MIKKINSIITPLTYVFFTLSIYQFYQDLVFYFDSSYINTSSLIYYICYAVCFAFISLYLLGKGMKYFNYSVIIMVFYPIVELVFVLIENLKFTTVLHSITSSISYYLSLFNIIFIIILWMMYINKKDTSNKNANTFLFCLLGVAAIYFVEITTVYFQYRNYYSSIVDFYINYNFVLWFFFLNVLIMCKTLFSKISNPSVEQVNTENTSLVNKINLLVKKYHINITLFVGLITLLLTFIRALNTSALIKGLFFDGSYEFNVLYSLATLVVIIIPLILIISNFIPQFVAIKKITNFLLPLVAAITLTVIYCLYSSSYNTYYSTISIRVAFYCYLLFMAGLSYLSYVDNKEITIKEEIPFIKPCLKTTLKVLSVRFSILIVDIKKLLQKNNPQQ